ncbi:MAG TPA: anhydro-N-acetylmuramic acid kinase, partial [Chloroflexota bacterium]|nr:anhydro-N-acetylmuramic acid kinase [Chloroflexota bacterium]
LQNIGGIANVTVLPAGARPEEVYAFDTGPGNMVVDALMQTFFERRYDAEGQVAARGRVADSLVEELLADEYFARRPPKTTGREQYGQFYAARLAEAVQRGGLTPADAVATATMLTARSIARAYAAFLPPIDDVIVSGGGAANPVLIEWLARELERLERPPSIRRPEDFGISADAKEAIGFAVLGYETLHGRIGTLPGCTGARHPVVLGALTPGENYRALLRRIDEPRSASAAVAGGFTEVEARMREGVARGVFPGAALVVGRREREEPVIAYAGGFGRQTTDPDAPGIDVDTVFDLASLTKVVATTTMAMILVDEGKLDLTAPVVAYLPAFGQRGKEQIRVLDLLTHCSGLAAVFPGGFPTYATALRLPRDRAAIISAACAQALVYPTGTDTVYSDLGIIALGAAMEAIVGERLDRFIGRRVFEPLGMATTLFAPPPPLWPRCAPTERDYWRGHLVRGEVHDECAWMMGGVSAHAGLFSTARDLAIFGQWLLGKGSYRDQTIVSTETFEKFVRRAERVSGSTRAIGWDTASPTSSSGPDLSPLAFGHTGFTGTSIWVDPVGQFFVVLLSNRVYPSRENQGIAAFRPRLHSAVVAALRG